MEENNKKLWKQAIKWPLYSVAILPVFITGAYLINQYKESQHKYLLIQNSLLSYRKKKIHLLKNLLSLNHFSLLIENN